MKLLFWSSMLLVLYTYVVYPVLLVVLASLSQIWRDLHFAATRYDRRRHSSTEALPTVSLVFSAFDEEMVIHSKMSNCAGIDYPKDRLEILVGCDGCSDRTVELARAAGLPNARIFDFPRRTGKPLVVNRLVAEAHGDIVAFCDANTMLDCDAIRLLARHFRQQEVGVACGELRLATPHEGSRAEGLYWRYERALKFLEGRLNALLGANGAIFAIRRQLFDPLPAWGIVDDFLVAMRIRAAGYRLVYDPEAIGREDAAASVGEEFHRRIRIGAGNFHALRYTWRLLNPAAGLVAFSYWSHKVFRWLVPFALPIAFFCTFVLAGDAFYAAMSWAGAGLTTLALVGYLLERRNLHSRVFNIPYYFVSMNLALLLGFLRFANSGQKITWSPTPRHALRSPAGDPQVMVAAHLTSPTTANPLGDTARSGSSR